MIDETVAEIEEMRTHSSSTVAIKATRAFEELLDREYTSRTAFERDLEQNAGVLRRANPSHATLHNAVRELEDAVVGNADDVASAKELLRETIDRVIDDVESGKGTAAENAAETFVDGETILTHDFSTTVLAAVEDAATSGCNLAVYVTEARPRYLGRKTARTLAGIDRVEPTLTVDSAMGHALRNCDRVVLGMTCIVEETYYNRVGTFPIAATARRLDVPVVVVGSGAKVVGEEFVFENEFRSGSEVMLEPVEGVTIENPTYDAIPLSLVDRVITDEGSFEPSDL
ncbi:translation initiation factor eIF-2B subunit delta [Halalkaliarchaeum desulfuricum]|uniref:Translation initiation factor eIF-2B subunit delta n=1 Tax=Halalkaliarchaeum desulfuricum TaxID=2055893 RepID=A0A343TIR8_9EURY|nr:translation initiation factor eIF-2B [Halalkaliarchaeum desulfuricum]AUX08990.1 translation initiation factor eIF-2B subunit delta [Halalkaliarchaeum desulfuricum]